MTDIQSKADINALIDAFYKELLKIDEIKPVFEGLDFEKHVPQIVHFWSFVLLDESGYTTNVFDKHTHLPIKPHHFDIWLKTFLETVDNLFAGEKADLAKQRAAVLTYTFKTKWEKIKS